MVGIHDDDFGDCDRGVRLEITMFGDASKEPKVEFNFQLVA